MKILCIIPARGGSKGIPKKNLKLLLGKPLIFHTLQTVKKLKKKINLTPIVSSEDKKILNYCKKQGFESDYIRPKKIAHDKSRLSSCVKDLVDFFKKKRKSFDTIIVLQPTTPFRKISEIVKAINKLKKENLESIMSVTPLREHPNESIIFKGKKWNYLVKPKKNYYGRQEFSKKYFFIDGSFYIFKTNFFLKNKSFISLKKTYPFILDRVWPIDIDYEEDLLHAEIIMKNNKTKL